MPTIKLVEMRNAPEKELYRVSGLVDTVKFSIGQRLSKLEVQTIVESGTYKVTISGEKQ